MKDMDVQTFQAGAAKTDITPPLGTFINGDFVIHYAQYIHDKLYAKALVMQQRSSLVALVVVDICIMPKDFLDEIKTEINRQTGIKPENILISSTHTHAAGSVSSAYLAAADTDYRKKLPPLIIKAVRLAKQNIRPAKIAWASADVPQHVLCRRYKMSGNYIALNPVTGMRDEVKTNPFGGEPDIEHGIAKTDPQVSFLAVMGTDNKWISVFANYSLHYVGDWDNGTISADYFGEFSKRIGQKLNAGSEFVAIMSNGTSGDVNIWDFVHPERYPSGKFEKSAFIGEDIAEQVFQRINGITWDSDPVLRAGYQELVLKLRKPSDDELEAAKRLVMESDYENFTMNDAGLQRLYAREQVLLDALPDELEFPLQAIKIGQGIIGGMGAEIFAETGLWLKENAPVKTYFSVGLANGNAGYVPPQHEHGRGGYETWRSRTSKLETRAEYLIKTALLKLIKDVNNQ